MNFSTRAIHTGSHPDSTTGAVIPPLSLSTTFAQPSPGQPLLGYDYSRSGNPNRNGLEEMITALERGSGMTIAFSSGSAGTAGVCQWCCLGEEEGGPVTEEERESGEKGEIICINDVYGGTYRYLTRVATATTSLRVTFLPLSTITPELLRSSITRSTRLVWVESPTNPLIILPDIKMISSVCKDISNSPCSPRRTNGLPRRPLLLVDNTFLSPYYSNPIADLGADLVLHSISKYINGHSDVIMGSISISPSLMPTLGKGLRFLQNSSGGIPSPFDCYLAQRGAKTLKLRALQHGMNALKVARYLQGDERVKEVRYPGLSTSEYYSRAKASLSIHAKKDLKALGWEFDTKSIVSAKERQEGGIPFSGMLSIRLATEDQDKVVVFLQQLKLFALAESLGGVESLAECPAIMTHASIPQSEREKTGITNSLVRLSVGIEDVDDLISDLDQALSITFSQ